mmetsp:Transcript_15414/g.33650  ORF Transcript_15414/g.33650 Transcript_15414/m.33650 type:complete len:221 (+) Transcript_15414:94-756(+)
MSVSLFFLTLYRTLLAHSPHSPCLPCLPYIHTPPTHAPPHPPSQHLGGDDESSIKPLDVVVSLEGGGEAVRADWDSVKASSPSKKSMRLSTVPDAVINLQDLPKEVADSLRAYDVDGDGHISLSEIVQGALQHQLSDEKVVFYRRMIIAIVCMWLLTMGAVFGVTYAAVALSKDTSVDEGHGEAKMTTADSNYVIQTANSDFYIASDGPPLHTSLNVLNP